MRVKSGLAEMLKGGVIMDVVNAEQAKIAEAAGAAAVMALERVPADIRRGALIGLGAGVLVLLAGAVYFRRKALIRSPKRS